MRWAMIKPLLSFFGVVLCAICLAPSASGQTAPTLHEHGYASVANAAATPSGTTVTFAFGSPFSGISAGSTLSVGWLHHHEVAPVGDTCPPDLDNDGMVATSDLLLLLADFGCVFDCSSDINGDGIVSSSDLLVLLAAYGDFCN